MTRPARPHTRFEPRRNTTKPQEPQASIQSGATHSAPPHHSVPFAHCALDAPAQLSIAYVPLHYRIYTLTWATSSPRGLCSAAVCPLSLFLVCMAVSASPASLRRCLYYTRARAV